MDAILRALAIYVFLLVIFRIAGKRTLSQMTPFDLILILVIGEATQQALLSDDYSLVNAGIVISMLIGMDIGVSFLKRSVPRFGRWTDGTPIVIFKDGKPVADRMKKERIEESDILEAARSSQGLERLDQVKYAVLEQTGSISIIPAGKK